jgi:hypothetical protein
MPKQVLWQYGETRPPFGFGVFPNPEDEEELTVYQNALIDKILEVIAIPNSLFGANINWEQANNMEYKMFIAVSQRISHIREEEIAAYKRHNK